MKLKLHTLDEDYAKYIKQFDYRVPNTSDEKKRRPFLGIVLKFNDIDYYVPLTSPKKKHKLMKNNVDFQKIEEGKCGAINFNNMIPVPENMVKVINFNEISVQSKDDVKYKNLLVKQLRWCQKEENMLLNKAKNVHRLVLDNKLENLTIRTCDFGLLEEKCRLFQRDRQKEDLGIKKSLLKKADETIMQKTITLNKERDIER